LYYLFYDMTIWKVSQAVRVPARQALRGRIPPFEQPSCQDNRFTVARSWVACIMTIVEWLDPLIQGEIS
jgi:hypothetical protein